MLGTQSCRDRRRKSNPSRSISRDDFSPGVVFRVTEAVQLLHGWERPEWPKKTRPRSYSLVERSECHGYNEMEESDADLSTSPLGYNIKRRASIAGQGITVYTGSLGHLVPNSFLQTTSRRVSTNGAAPGCSCTSCGSTVTPYWRDGWAPDVMLCNACGLRFQKFARRCPSCMYIPRKEDSLGDRCVKCSTLWVVGPAGG